MVGVAGRSKGCVTCRARRVKCDETHPACSRCIKANRECGGYRLNNFIDGLPQKIRKQVPVSPVVATPAPTGTTVVALEDFENINASSTQSLAVTEENVLPWQQRVAGTGHTSQFEPELDFDFSIAPEPTPSLQELIAMTNCAKGKFGGLMPFASEEAKTTAPPLFQTLNLLPFQDDMYLTYTRNNLLRGATPVLDASNVEHLTDGRLVSDCILCIATVYFGRRHHQPDIINLGLRRYGRVLTQLNKALSHPVHSKSLLVLSSIQILTLFEFLSPSSIYGWINHSLGLEQLFAHRGPRMHMDSKGLETFEQFRQTIVMASMAAEKPSLLATKEWLTIPWSLHPERKSMLQKLMDTMILISPLMRATSRYWKLASPTAEDQISLRSVGRRFKTVIAALDRWWIEFNYKHHEDYWKVSKNDVDYVRNANTKTEPECLRYIYCFENTAIAEAFTYYHATRVLSLGIARGIDAVMGSASPAELSMLAIAARSSAEDICRCVDYQLDPLHDGIGSITLIFPLRMAWKALGGNTLEGKWLWEIAELVALGFRGGAWAALPLLIFGDYKITNGLMDVRNG